MKKLLSFIFFIIVYSSTAFSQSSVSVSTNKSKNISTQSSLEPSVSATPGSATNKNLIISNELEAQPLLISNIDTITGISLKRSSASKPLLKDEKKYKPETKQ